MSELVFNAELHEYRLDGRLLPSVTTVLKPLSNYGHVDPDVLAAAAEFGTHVHMACDLDVRGVLDEASLDPALVPHFNAWRRFRAESGFTITESEQAVYHAKLGYAGTLDLIGTDPKGKLALIDIKTGIVPATVGPQTAAYDAARVAMGLPKCRLRYCLQLRANDYRLIPLTDPADLTIFTSCLNILNWRNKNVSY